MVLSNYMGPGKPAQVLCKSSQRSKSLCHLSSLRWTLEFPWKDAVTLKAEVRTWVGKALCLEMDAGWGSITRSVMPLLRLDRDWASLAFTVPSAGEQL